jgi:hypothetical protein
MKSIGNWKKAGIISLAAGFIFCVAASGALAAEMKAEKKEMKGSGAMEKEKAVSPAEKAVVAGVKMMMKGKKDLLAGLGKQKLSKDPKFVTEINKLNEGDKQVMAGNKMIGKKGERTKAKEMIMAGTTMMMEAKDAIMAELKSRGMMQEGKLQEGEKLISNGDNKMLEGKNGMMDGLKNWE